MVSNYYVRVIASIQQIIKREKRESNSRPEKEASNAWMTMRRRPTASKKHEREILRKIINGRKAQQANQKCSECFPKKFICVVWYRTYVHIVLRQRRTTRLC